MSRINGLRKRDRIEADIIPFLKRNYLWDEKLNQPCSTLIKNNWVELIKDNEESGIYNCEFVEKKHWHFTEYGKENICILIKNIY